MLFSLVPLLLLHQNFLVHITEKDLRKLPTLHFTLKLEVLRMSKARILAKTLKTIKS